MDTKPPDTAKERQSRVAQGRRGFAVAALIVVPIILGLVAQILLSEFRRSDALHAEVNRSYEVRTAVQRLFSLHQDIETGQRGYVLTGSAAFLEPYRIALGQVDRVLGELAGSSVVPDEVEKLRTVSLAQRRFVARVVEARRNGRTEDAAALVRTGEGKRAMDAIRLYIWRIERAEQARLQERGERADAAQRDARRLGLGLLAGLALLLLAAAISNSRANRARRLALRRLEDQRARQEAIFNGAKDGILTLNESGSIETINPAAARMYGYRPEELLRRDISVLFEAAPEQGAVESFLSRLQRRRRGETGSVQEFVGKRADGSVFPIEVAISPIAIAGGTRYVSIIRDTTERKQVERMKSEFVSTVSHELRTPLTSIAGSLGLLRGGAAGELPDRASRLIEIAHSNSERLVRLINDILDMEKMESGKMRFEVAPLSVAQLVGLGVQANAGYAEDHKVTLVTEPIDPNARVYADPDRMMQVLANLLSNAIKFSPEGGEVRIGAKPLGRQYRIWVSDKGAGIPEEFRPRIFGKFAQADSTDRRQQGGTGLGLSIVREIVTRLNGSVGFESEIGLGTTFHIDLPAVAPESAERIESGTIGSGELPKLLHVEDDPDMLRLVASAFEHRAQVFSTPSVEEARAAILRHDFDAVILDVGMTDGSGLELIPLLREQSPAAPIVLFTAQDVQDEIASSADAVLVKSRASLDALVERIETELGRSNGQMQGHA